MMATSQAGSKALTTRETCQDPQASTKASSKTPSLTSSTGPLRTIRLNGVELRIHQEVLQARFPKALESCFSFSPLFIKFLGFISDEAYAIFFTWLYGGVIHGSKRQIADISILGQVLAIAVVHELTELASRVIHRIKDAYLQADDPYMARSAAEYASCKCLRNFSVDLDVRAFGPEHWRKCKNPVQYPHDYVIEVLARTLEISGEEDDKDFIPGSWREWLQSVRPCAYIGEYLCNDCRNGITSLSSLDHHESILPYITVKYVPTKRVRKVLLTNITDISQIRQSQFTFATKTTAQFCNHSLFTKK